MDRSSSEEIRFRLLFDEHYPSIVAYFKRRIDSNDAYDAADDVFLVAWRRIDVVPRGAEALPWLYGVAARVTANRRRSARRASRLRDRLFWIGVSPSPSAEVQVLRHADDQAVLDAIAAMRPQDQELLRLAAWEELPHAEIGEILGCSRKAVDARLHRAIRRLAKVMDPTGHISPVTDGEHARGKA